MKYLVIGCIFTFVFALSSAFSNAVFSISTVLCCLMIIYLKLWDKIDITELNIRPVMIAYLIFWISLIIHLCYWEINIVLSRVLIISIILYH